MEEDTQHWPLTAISSHIYKDTYTTHTHAKQKPKQQMEQKTTRYKFSKNVSRAVADFLNWNFHWFRLKFDTEN